MNDKFVDRAAQTIAAGEELSPFEEGAMQNPVFSRKVHFRVAGLTGAPAPMHLLGSWPNDGPLPPTAWEADGKSFQATNTQDDGKVVVTVRSYGRELEGMHVVHFRESRPSWSLADYLELIRRYGYDKDHLPRPR